ncbi:hypothetical protein [Methylorubrum podarium]|jgi:uncharacterized iron-regulated membrane protein|uniref:hypothetical protein n=1 Tax=Methylorubrum podarium TaxID=200476 RepID=UPI001EE35DAB|nr:hypothetical protein [Methylorubrum podarium]GJE72608.1 hypothetical protein CHKEEEPN_4165 [Methylorubrum podarium]
MDQQRSGRSALSAPQNFISESLPRRLYRGHRWALWMLFVVLGGASALLVFERVGAILPRPEVSPQSRPSDVPLQDLVQREQDLMARLKQLDVPAELPARPAEAKDAERTGPEQTQKAPPQPTEASKPASLQERDETTASVLPNSSASESAKASSQKPDTALDRVQALERADHYLGRGQYTIARYLYEEAYRAGDIQGALGMAKSYDAVYLKSKGLRAKGDPQRARIWYRRAAEIKDGLRKPAP